MKYGTEDALGGGHGSSCNILLSGKSVKKDCELKKKSQTPSHPW